MKENTIRAENIFHVHRQEIAAISAADNCDVGTAAREWAHEHGVPYGEELKEFTDYVAYLQSETNKGKNFVRRYFAGDSE